MRTELERDDFIVLLEKLKSEEDAEVLAAARDINAKMTVAGVEWDDLLMSQDDGASDETDDYEPDDDDEAEAEAEAEAEDEAEAEAEDEAEAEAKDEDEQSLPDDDEEDDDGDNPLSDEEKQEAASLINAIRALEISETTKEELKEYEQDIKDGEFEQMDIRYLRALKARLKA